MRREDQIVEARKLLGHLDKRTTALAEDIYAGRGQDGLWWFWWSWAERIAGGEDLEGAAAMIEHVLAAGG